MPERWLTYAEAGALLGMTPEAVRQRARRHDWPTRKTGNKPNDPNEVLIPDTVPVRPVGQPTARPTERPPDQPPGQPGDAATVADTMAALAAELRDAALQRAVAAEREAQQEREQRARAEGELDGLREAMRRADAAVAEAHRRADEAAVRLREGQERLDRAQAATREARERLEQHRRERDAEAMALRGDVQGERERANAALARAVEAEEKAAELMAGGRLRRALRALLDRPKP